MNTEEFVNILSEKIQQEQEGKWEDAGKVLSVKDGILTISGLKNAKSMELIRTANNAEGLIFNLEKHLVKAVLFNNASVQEGEIVYGTSKVFVVPVGNFFGRVLNSKLEPLDEQDPPKPEFFLPIEQEPTSIIDRSPVCRPLNTGISAIDCLIPIGRGQREMILGDKRTGKTTIALQTILNQKHTHATPNPVFCIYVSIGQRNSSVAKIKRLLEENDAMSYTVIVHSSAADTALMKFITPYAAMSLAEHLKSQKKDVLIVFDDLYQHAIAYREISLLLRRPPGREAFPGDIFYIHSRLLERGSQDKRGGSITALPIVETQGGDISSYIATNIISITDGQIFLSADLLNSGIKPAINIGISVSRIGSAAQSDPIKKVSAKLKSFLAQYEELKEFSSFLSEIDETTQQILNKGNFLRNVVFLQDESELLSICDQFMLILVSENKNFITIKPEHMEELKKQILHNIRYNHRNFYNMINNEPFSEEILQVAKSHIEDFMESFTGEK